MATIVASAAGGVWSAGASWVGGVAPGAGDDAVLNGTSGNISLSAATTYACRSIDCTGYTGTLSWGGATARLNVGDASGGSAKFVAGMTVTPSTGILGFVSTTASTTYTLTSGGKTLPNVIVAVGASTTIQLADNLTTVSSGTTGITLTSGILDLNGKTVVAPIMTLAGSTARTLTPGAANITLSAAIPWAATVITNLTITANTATVTCTAATATFNGGGADYNGMTLVHSAFLFVITGANTFGNLTRNGSAAIDSAMNIDANQTITGTLTVAGNAVANRLWVKSTIVGTPRTLTVGTTVTASRVDFEDITGAGAASWNLTGITDGSGDCGGNSGMTLSTPRTLYGMSSGTVNFLAAGNIWALTSGGAAVSNVALPQDDVVLDANSTAATYVINGQRVCKNLTCTGYTGTLSLASNVTSRYILGSLTLGSGMTLTATGTLTFAGRGSHTIDMAGKAFTAASSRLITIGRFGGTYTLLSDANFGSLSSATFSGLSIANNPTGTFTANGFNVTASRVGINPATVNMGSGTWTLTGTETSGPWVCLSGTTLNAGTSNIVIATATTNLRTFDGGGKTYYDLTYTVAGSTGGLDIVGSNTFHDLNFSDVTNARTIRFTAGTTTTFTGDPNIGGTAGKLMTIGSITAANHNLVKTGAIVSKDYLSISRSQASPANTWYAGANSTDGGNNSGWIFTAPPLTQGNMFFMF